VSDRRTPAAVEVDLDALCIDTIRFLAVDAVEQAASGHPGMPMGAAPMAYLLWTRHLRHDPTDPLWFDRDRFVLSAGHGSMLLYALLHLCGYAMTIDDLRRFRQLGSPTPGHPERDLPRGIETTTGPLGQGLGHAVGMAIAEAHLAARFNRPDHPIIGHRTWVIAGDGDLMEGVSYEAASLAGHLGLGRLNVLYDDNRITLAASTALSFSEDRAARFAAAGWHTVTVDDGNDLAALEKAMAAAEAEESRPSLLLVRTHIGYGAPHKQDTFGVHGSPLGAEETAAAKRQLGWPQEPTFHVPDAVRTRFAELRDAGAAAHAEWRKRLERYAADHPDAAAELERRISGHLPDGWDRDLPHFAADAKGQATRVAGGTVLGALGERVPELVGGSADLDPSTHTALEGQGDFQDPRRRPDDDQGAVGGGWNYAGRNVHFGVREHAMGAAAGGMAAHGGVRSYTATFLTFSDYMRPPMRLAALMKLPVVYVFTHDSIALGEDGPTHQSVEHLAALRAVPGLEVIRPGDAAETVEAWRAAVASPDHPTVLVLTRQKIPTLDRTELAPASGLARGAYVLAEAPDGAPRLILVATGSELHLAVAARERLVAAGIPTRVVSMPCWERFAAESRDYQESVLPPSVTARLAVEAGVAMGWHRWVGSRGDVVSIDRFGESAPGDQVMETFGFTIDHVVARAQALLAGEE
jgi:transketolase